MFLVAQNLQWWERDVLNRMESLNLLGKSRERGDIMIE